MEQLLLKLARQLDAMDEASLTALWDKYAAQVQHFEPSQRWQEAVMVLSFIQAKRWKNQLFNTQWAERVRKGNPAPPPPQMTTFELEQKKNPKGRKAKVLSFRPDTSPE